MSQPTREELLTLALGVLPELPDTVDVLSEDGGCFPLVLEGREEGMLLGQAPRLFKSGRHAPEFFADMWRTILARASWQGELVNKRKDGTLADTSHGLAELCRQHQATGPATETPKPISSP